MLLNSEFSREAAKRLAERAAEKFPKDRTQQIDFIYRVCLARRPSDEEREIALTFLAGAATDPASEEDQPATLIDFCLAMLNSSEFVYLE